MITEPQKQKSIYFYLKWLIALLIVLVIYLNNVGYLEPTFKFLDSPQLTFKVGKMNISLYEILITAVAIIGVLWFASVASSFAEGRIAQISGIDKANKALIAKFLQISIFAIAILVGLGAAGIDLSSFAIVGGALGIGIGFGLQKITSNFVSGLILLFEKSIVTDDLVELSDGTSGVVRQIRARFTMIEKADGSEALIPNEDLVTNRVLNFTYSHRRSRVDVIVPVAYESNPELAMKLMLEAATEHLRTIEEPAPSCFVREFSNLSINLLLSFWVNDVTEGKYGPQSDVMLSILKKFKENNINIPVVPRDYGPPAPPAPAQE